MAGGSSGGEIIKEFVVSIKYKVDDSALDDANKNIGAGLSNSINMFRSHNKVLTGLIEAASLGFRGYILGLGGVAGGMAAVVDDVSKKFANLYYQQQQMSSTFKGSIADLMQLQLASKLSGMSQDDLTQSLQATAKAMRDLPKQVLLNVGTGGATDPLKAMENMAKNYQSAVNDGQEMIYRKILNSAGINPDTIRQLSLNLPNIQSALDENQKTLDNLGKTWNDLGKSAVDFQRQFELADTQFSEALDVFTLSAMPKLTQALDSLNQYISQHSSELNTDVIQFEHTMGVIMQIMEFLNSTVGRAVVWAAEGTAQDISGAQATASGHADQSNLVGKLIGLILNPAEALLGQKTYDKETAQYNKDTADGTYQKNADKAANWLQTTGGKASGWIQDNVWQPFSNWVQEKTHSPFVQIYEAQGLWSALSKWANGSLAPYVRIQQDGSQPSAIEQAVTNMGQSIAKSASLPQTAGLAISSGQQKKNIDQTVQYFTNRGLTQEQAVGVAARLFGESGLNPNAVNPSSGAYGVAQWLGSRKDAATATNGDLNSQLGLIWKEWHTTEKKAFDAITGAKTASDAAGAMEGYERANDPAFTAKTEVFANHLMKHMGRAASLLAPAGRAYQSPDGIAPNSPAGGHSYAFSPTTTIHVHAGGASGPEIGTKTAKAVNRVHSTLYRNFQTQIS